MLHFSRWKTVMVLAVCGLAALLFAPNLLSRDQLEALPSWLPTRQITLGLDLQGGSHLLLQVETEAVVRDRLDALVDTIRSTLRESRIRYRELGVDGQAVAVTIADPAEVEEATKQLRALDPDTALTADDDGRLRLELSDKAVRERESAAVDQSIEIIRRRIDETGVREPTIQRQGASRILVQLPGLDDPQRIKALIGKTAKMTFHLVDDTADPAEAMNGRPPPGSEVLPLIDRRAPAGAEPRLVVRKRVMVSGENLVDAEPSFSQGAPVVSFRFDAAGGKRFGDVTSHNVGKQLAIVLDGQVISAPNIREPILGGSGIISGSFTVAEAQDLALLLRAGALPAPLEVIEERSVGPGLGADSIAAGKLASIVGTVAVVVFMVLCYGLFGLFANLALAVNILLLLACMSVLGATLTLPGIAGIVLTVGMAVDSNVLIFEHIREEARAGRTPISAIDAGFSRAMTTIIDANLTTLIAGCLLYIFGSGPVRGFAVTLSFGILTTMFTAVTVTRLIVVTWLRRTRPQLLPI
ncbi:MAG: protein translocase subunit SecD [Rhodospirillales bacterium]|nr:protein translocase subunit SecD [Rhodospirillales bacterium]